LIKKYILLLGIIVGTFYSFLSLDPLAKKTLTEMDLNGNEYSLINYQKKNIGKINVGGMNHENHPPFFKYVPKYIDAGCYFIHPASKKTAKGVFTFYDHYLLEFDFSIQEGSHVGDIEFIVKKNKKEINRFVVTSKAKHSIKISVKKNDKIEVVADKHGVAVADWGNLHIYIVNEKFVVENLLIAFLWSLLFIFLFGKGHTYIAINSYIVFLLMLFAEKLNFGVMGFDILIYYTILSFALTFLFVFIYQELIILRKFKIATIFSFIILFSVYVIPLSFIIYALNFGQSVTTEILFAVFQSNKDESLEFLSISVPLKYIFLFITVTLIIGIFLYKQEKKETNKIERSLLLFIIIILFTMFFMGLSNLRVPNFILNNYEEYNIELIKFSNMQKQRKNGQIKFKSIKKEQGETYVIVIGESLSKLNMGAYGYMRNTTPNISFLAKNNSLILYENAYSNDVQTMKVLSHALTEANQYNHKKYFNSLSLVNIFNKANFETYWITNQKFLGDFDNLIAILGHDAEHKVPLNHNYGFDEVLEFDGASIEVLEKVLNKKTSKNRAIFIHLMGSHFIYKYRYPNDKFDKFKDDTTQLKFGKYSNNHEINDYDNSVYYNDYVVTNLLKKLKEHQGVSAFLYFSDHAEDILRGLKHSPTHIKPIMSQIPLIIWLSEEYKNRYPKKYETLKEHKETVFSNDLIYDTLIGMSNISTDRYNSKFDFSSKEYKLKPENALFLHGKKHYINNNHIYWREKNSKELKKLNQIDRVIPKEANVIGKFYQVFKSGYKIISLNVSVDKTNADILHLGVDKKAIKETLEDYLASIPYDQIKKIIINIKNISTDNHQKVLKKLQYLDSKYSIKQKSIIEFNKPNSFIADFSKNSWHTSLFLDKKELDKLSIDNNISRLKELSLQINQLGLEVITLDDKTYISIEEYLTPLLNDNIKYMINVNNLTLGQSNFIDNLKKSKIYSDDKVEIIRVEYPSLYEL
jgi:glucan phosphoethanolaminetransferase (alkaline phosphatase superfamily)